MNRLDWIEILELQETGQLGEPRKEEPSPKPEDYEKEGEKFLP